MAAYNESVGLMHPAYFVGRAELLDWLNATLELKLTRVEETASGAVACQILDLLFPNGLVQMSKVNWGAQAEWEFVQNYKILQLACDRVKCTKRIDVDRLIKGRQQDNLEFLQWLKKFFDDNYDAGGGGVPYDPVQRRALGKGKAKWMMTGTSPTPTSSTTVKRYTAPPPTQRKPSVQAKSALPTRFSPPNKSTTSSTSPTTTLSAAKETNASAMELVELRMKIAGMKQEIQDLCLEHDAKMRAVEKELRRAEEESEYYFEKLSKIEALVVSKQRGGVELGGVDGLIGKLDTILFDEPASQVTVTITQSAEG